MKKLLCVTAIAATISVPAAMAGKSDGVLRMAFQDPIEKIDEVFDPKGETGFTSRAVNATLIQYDPASGDYVGWAAESYSSVDPSTWEFKLREGLTFQDGSPLTAEDVAYSFNFRVREDVQFRLKTRWGAFAGAEAVDDLTVHVKTKRPYALALARISVTAIWPSDAHSALQDPSTWGKAPVGAGMYKATTVDPDQGIVLERWEDYQLGEKPEIERIEIKPIPDSQARMAAMMVGDIDLTAVNQVDLIQAMTANPNLTSTVSEDLQYIYILLDAADRSGIGHLTDIRVRQAIFHAIDREAVRTNVFAGGENTAELARICVVTMAACPDGGGEPAFDPDKARALLAEAGLADGFDVEITTVNHVAKAAEAIAGYLREVGIRASINSQTMGGYRKAQADGKINILVQNFGHGGLADAGNALNFYYASKARDYAQDDELKALIRNAGGTIDIAERTELNRQAYDMIRDKAYIMTIGSNPFVFVHSSELVLDTSDKGAMLTPYGSHVRMFKWAD